MLAQLCAILLFLWAPVSARILALVLQLYARNTLKLKQQPYYFCLMANFQVTTQDKARNLLSALGAEKLYSQHKPIQ